MTHDVRKWLMTVVLGTVFLTTSQDAYSSRQSHSGMSHNEYPVCSEDPTQASVQRMKAVQSLRETQIEVEMMKRQQGITADR